MTPADRREAIGAALAHLALLALAGLAVAYAGQWLVMLAALAILLPEATRLGGVVLLVAWGMWGWL